MTKLGCWKRLRDGMDGITPGGAPLWVCGGCGESAHLHGIEYPKRKMICDGCGRINIYPGEAAYEYKSSLWEDDDDET